MQRAIDFFSRLKLRLSHNDRAEQRLADALRAYFLLSIHEKLPSNLIGKDSELQRSDDPKALLLPFIDDDQDEDTDRTKDLPSSQRQIENTVDRMVSKQVHRLFDLVVASGGIDVYPSPAYASKVRRRQQAGGSDRLAEKQSKRGSRGSREEDAEEGAILNRRIEHPDGYTLRIQPSTIDHPDAGFGVHVSGVIPVGSVIGFYPGSIYYPRDLTPEVVQDNGYLISRYDGLVFDGRGWGEFSMKQRAEIREQRAAGLVHLVTNRPTKYLNPYGIGSYINHPPAGADSNVVWYGYDFLEANTSEAYRPYVPNQLVSSFSVLYPQWHSLVSPTIVMVASRTIQNEELYLDYRLNPNLPYPEWYTPCDLEEAQKRWSPASILM